MYNNSTGLPSVTDVISPYIETRWFTQECRDRGSSVHAACEAHLLGLYFLPLEPVIQMYVESFKRWADFAIDEIVLTEKRLTDKSLGFCGQFDAILILKDSRKPVLVDWKTSASEQKSWRIQIAAYRHLAATNGLRTQSGMSVRLKASGTGAIINEYSHDYKNDFNIFVGLLNSFKYFKCGH